MGEVHKLVGIKPIFTTPYHPMMNGKLERQHAVLKSILSKLCASKPKDWDRYLVPTLFAMREIPSDTTGFSPFELLYGRKVRGPLAILRDLWSEPNLANDTRSSYQYVLELRERLEDSAEIAASNANMNASVYKSYFDKNSVKRTFKVGDEILLLLPDSSNKLLSSWKGPYTVTEVKSKVNYMINKDGKSKLFHVNMLKPYYRRAIVGSLCAIDEQPILVAAGVSSQDLVQTCVIEDDPKALLLLPDHVPGAGFDINPQLDATQRADVEAVLDKYADVLSDSPGCTGTLTHEIHLTTTDTVCNKTYPVPIHLKSFFDEEVDQMLDMGVIRPSKSNFCNPSVMVEKAGTNPKSYRLTQDFRALNSVTKFDAEPMPSMDADLHKFSDSIYFTEIDVTRAYYQIPLSENSRHYTAFSTSKGLMEYCRMPFGLVTACASYIRLMRKIFCDLTPEENEHISIYFDNIFIATPDWKTHVELLEAVFSRLRKHGITARPSKCHYGYPTVNYLGFRVGQGNLMPNEDKVNSLTSMRLPTRKKELRSFLGLISFYRKFVPNMADLTATLSDMLRKEAPEPLVWTESDEQKFHKIIKLIASEPILKLPDMKKKFCLRTDASNIGISGVLLQYHDNIPMPVHFISRKLLDRERNYSPIEKECLALVWAIDKLRYYLYGAKFIIECDHRPLVYLKKFKGSNAKLMRWALSLQPYNYDVVYIPGKDNHHADILSRCTE